MTLIAHLVNNIFKEENGMGSPILIGDILISSRDVGDNMPTPTYTEGTGHLYGNRSA
jgi:hypothetical protein